MCFSVSAFCQTKCDELEPLINELLLSSQDDNSGRVFISDGQVYKAFISDAEKAEFKATINRTNPDCKGRIKSLFRW